MEIPFSSSTVRPDAPAVMRAISSASEEIEREPGGHLRGLISWGARAAFDLLADVRVVRSGVALVAHALPPPRVRLTRQVVIVPRLPPQLNGLRVMQLSDLHLHAGSELALQVPELVADIPHDLLCYTGDFIDSNGDIPQLAALLAKMPHHAPAFAVLGNHDYRPFGGKRGTNDVFRLRQVLTAAGIQMLDNTAVSAFGGQLFVAGVDDPATYRDKLNRALAPIPPNTCTLLLAHSPDIALRLGMARPDLILSGHTHGGQIRLPLLGAVRTEIRLPRRFAMGLHHYQQVPIFVTRGIGYSGIDLRLDCPSEVALLTLRSAP